MDIHHLANYVIGGAALCLAATGFSVATQNAKRAVQLDSAISHIAPEQHSRLSWPDLTQDQVIALGEALKRTGLGPTVTIYCASTNCAALRNDLDDAFQIAGWATDFEEQPVESEEDEGILMSNTPEADALALAVAHETLWTIHRVQIDGIKGVGVIIGKKPR